VVGVEDEDAEAETEVEADVVDEMVEAEVEEFLE
jgi:hypothetical protein